MAKVSVKTMSRSSASRASALRSHRTGLWIREKRQLLAVSSSTTMKRRVTLINTATMAEIMMSLLTWTWAQ